jgi:hemerythrin-like metal-binding protein
MKRVDRRYAIFLPGRDMITWDPDTHDVGIHEIDQQHRMLVEIINRIDSALHTAAPKVVLRGLLDELLQYAEYHFFTEEHYMHRHGYPDEITHREAHHHLIDALLKMHDDFINRERHDPRSAVDFLASWLTDHIVYVDKPLGSFLQTRGLK